MSSMLAQGDSIDDTAVLRADAAGGLFNDTRVNRPGESGDFLV